MNLLQVLFIVSAFLILILWIDIAKKQRFSFLHIFLFIWIAIALIVFTIFPSVLAWFGNIFWVQRWADVLVYISILFLIYFVLFLFNKIEENSSQLTSFIREFALNNSNKKKLDSNILFVIPAYNEWKVIENTLQSIIEKWYKDVLLINDWSTDNTSNILEKYKDQIIILNHIKNRGQWAALETWFEYIRRFLMESKLEYVVTFDSDWQHDLDDLPLFFDKFNKDKELQIVLWSRFIDKPKYDIPVKKKIILFLWKVFTFIISWKYFSDVHNGYRVFKKEVLNQIKLENDWMTHASEIQDKIVLKKIKFAEVPVNIKYTDYSVWKGQKSSNAIFIALKMIWTKFFK